MGDNRGDLHRLVDALDEQQLSDAEELLRTLQPRTELPHQARRRLPLTGAYDSGRSDTATRSAEILREAAGSRNLHGE